MKKCLLVIAILMVSQLNTLYSQTLPQTLFNGPDTVCVNQPIKLTSNVFNQNSYYWGFCSGYLDNAPSGVNMGDNFGFSIPSNIDIVNDSGTYYGFVINAYTTEFLRLNFGSSLNNVPTVTNFGNLTNGLPVNPTSLFIVKDTLAHHWFVFVSGGFTKATSSLGRIDFGPHLNNPAPNIANFHNPGNLLDFPKGLFVAKDANHQWVGYCVNYNSSELIKLDFTFNVSNTPLAYNYGNVDGVLNNPSDLAATVENGNWYFFITNYISSELIRIDMGPSLSPATPNGFSLGDYNFRILRPSSLAITKDCNNIHIYITDSTTSQLIKISGPSVLVLNDSIDYSVVGGMNFPSSISSIIRDKDNLYAFIANGQDSTLTKITFNSCTNSSIPSFTEVAPPLYHYTAPGVYNVYYVVNDGLPNMAIDCKDITVLAPPPTYLHPNTTICQGDTVRLYAISTLADSVIWTSTNNIDTIYTYRDSVRVFPTANATYPIILYYPFGCIVDTAIHINVVKVTADAGPDRFIRDGAVTTLGGPYTSIDNESDLPATPVKFMYHWDPYQFMVDSTVPNAVVSPPYDFTYYLTVTQIGSETQCSAKDTVVVHINCGEINAPNAFSPTSNNPVANRFGILNKEVSKLNYFRIYNRFGQLVFTTTDPTQKWDGLFNGTLAEEGVYVWEADAFCISGKEFKKTGNVTLLR